MTGVARGLARLENLWESVDELFGSYDESQWARPHGAEWTFADVPFHFGYFDAEAIAGPIAADGSAVDPMNSVEDVDRWNDDRFAKRPETGVAYALARMEQGRAAIRAAVAGAAPDQEVVVPLAGLDPLPVAGVLTHGLAHTWSHLNEAAYRSRSAVRANPEVSAMAVEATLVLMTIVLDRDAASDASLTIGFDVGAIGSYTLAIADGDGHVSKSDGSPVDLRFRFADEQAFARMFSGVSNLGRLLLTRAVRIKGYSKMRLFGTLLPPPAGSRVIERRLLQLPT